MFYLKCWGTRWRSWLRHCATNRKIAGSIPDVVFGIFHWHNPAGHTIALGVTQPLTEMGTRNISWGGKGGRCVGLTNLPPSYADCLEIWELQPPGTLRACPGLSWDCLFFLFKICWWKLYTELNAEWHICSSTVYSHHTQSAFVGCVHVTSFTFHEWREMICRPLCTRVSH